MIRSASYVENNPTWLPCVILVLLTAVAYAGVLDAGFIANWDDDIYVTANPIVNRGFSVKAFIESITTLVSGNWTPLTLWSHMLDVELYGLNPAGHHATNLIIHIINAMLLYGLFAKTTARKGRSFLVAALFALHPLHAESVAWVAERKDVLSSMFALLALTAYRTYTGSGRSMHYSAMFCCVCLSLMAKPMYVTLPFVMLLMDYWPLCRTEATPLKKLILEKAPILVPVSAASWLAVIAQGSQALAPVRDNPLATSIPNAAKAYASYLQKTLWPTDLSFFYPYRQVTLGEALLPFSVILAVSIAAWFWRKKRPWLIFGWLWFLGILIPVIGIVRVGMHSHADRYTYLPLTGIFIVIVWGLAELSEGLPFKKPLTYAAAAVAILVSLLFTRSQAAAWKDGENLFRKALAVDGANWIAHLNLGVILLDRNRNLEAMKHFNEGIKTGYSYELPYNLGIAQWRLGMTAAALESLRKSITMKPFFPDSHRALSDLLLESGNPNAALDAALYGIKHARRDALLQFQVGKILMMTGRKEEAQEYFRAALAIDPSLTVPQ